MDIIDYNWAKRIDNKVGTPFYLIDIEQYKRNISNFLGSFRSLYKKVGAGYSFKTNYVPMLCLAAKELGCYAEVVSEMEFDLAVRLGFDKIILNGPIKSKELIFRALRMGAILNLDSRYEIDSIIEYRKLNPTDSINIGLRINMELTHEGKSVIQNGLRFGRFGFTIEMLDSIVPLLSKYDIRVNSLHGHTSSSDRAVSNYEKITEHLLEVIKRYQFNDVEFFNVGGGFFGAAANGIDVSNKPTYSDYAQKITDILFKNDWFKVNQPTILIEPGVSVVANTFSYVSKLYQFKRIGDKNFISTDGSVFDVKPTMHSLNLPYKVLSSSPADQNEKVVVDVVGSTCMEKDVILKEVIMDKPNRGDYILISGIGAYTLVMTPNFINYQSPILTLKDNEIVLVRKRQCLDDILATYNY